jgi:hypothetical protein
MNFNEILRADEIANGAPSRAIGEMKPSTQDTGVRNSLTISRGECFPNGPAG